MPASLHSHAPAATPAVNAIKAMRKGDHTRQLILDQATRIASRVGIGGLTIGTLATQTGLSKGGLFAHFKSKEQLQQQVLAHAQSYFTSKVITPAQKAPPGEPRLRALFENWVAWCKGNVLPGGCLFFAAAVELDDQPGPVRDQLITIQRQWLATLADSFAEGVRAGHFAAGTEPGQFAQGFLGLMLGYAHMNRLLNDPDAEQYLRRSFDALLAGRGQR